MSSKWLVIPFCLLATLRAPAQELSLFISQAWSDNSETGKPLGVGASISKTFAGSFAVGVSYERFSTERSYEGFTSDELGFRPVWEPIEGSVRTTAWKLRVSYLPVRLAYVSFGVGSAVSTNSIHISNSGTQTGRTVAEQGGHKFGFGFSLITRIAPVKSLPLAVRIEAERHFLGESTEVATDAGMPVSGKIAMNSLSLGVTYGF